MFFTTHKHEIQELLKNDLSKSLYNGIIDELDDLVVLADRLAISCQKHPQFTNISSFLKNLEKAFSIQNDPDEASQLLMNVEKWIKPVLYFSDREKWETLNNKDKQFFTLTPTVIQLQMLTDQEIQADKPDAFEDVGKKYIWIAINSRNYETHNTALPPIERRSIYLRCALTIILAPLYQNYDIIKGNLEGLVCRQIDSEVEDLIASIRVSRREEIKGFKARQGLVEKIVGKLKCELRESGGYYLLTGIEGIGKTALCAKVSEQLIENQNSLIEPDINLKQAAPWLPGQLIHFGKWDSDPVRILRSLIVQANTMLLEPEDLPNHASDYQELDKISFFKNSQVKKAVSGEHFSSFSKQLITPAKNFSNSMHQENIVSLPFNKHSINQPHSTSSRSELETHKAILNRALRKLTKQYGPVVLIIDALDEITTFADNLEFLPRQLPPGVSALLTVRPNLGIEKWLTNYSSALVYHDQVGYIEREEIPLFTGIADFAGKEEKRFNDEIYRNSKGWSLQIAAIARKLKEVNGDFKQVDVEDELVKYFDRQKDEWLCAYEDERGEYLKEILNLLSIFEPICAISLDDVQGYLEQKFNERLNLDKIIDLLKPVSYQIQGLETAKKKIKLGIKAYADYVRKCIGKRDLKRHLEDYTEWMKQDEEIESKLVADFVNYWMSEGSRKEIGIVKEIIDNLIKEEELEKVQALASHMITSGKEVPQGYKYCMRELASLGKPKAVLNYAKLILMGKGSKEYEKKEAEEWLRKSANKDNPPILCFFGSYLMDDKEEEELRIEGEQYLRLAIEQGYQLGKIILGSRLIEGRCSDDKVEGYELLEELVEEGHEMGTLRLVHFLMKTEKPEANPEKAYSLLRVLAEEQENIQAMLTLGLNLIIGDIFDKDVQGGEQWLRKAAAKENVQAMYFLGVELIEGENLIQRKEEGIEWLEKAIVLEHKESCLQLADYYLKGEYLEEDMIKGKSWLLEAVKMRSTSAMLILGRVYLYQLWGFPQNNDEASKWLRMAVDEGSNHACLILGETLVKGIGFKQNYNLGISYLQKAVKRDFLDAYSSLGMAYLTGNGLSSKRIEGEKILRQGMEKGANDAKINLAIELAKGERLTKRIEESKRLFDELIEDGVDDAIQVRCYYTLVEKTFDETAEEIEALLWREIDKGNPEAMTVLAEYLEEGKYLKQDIESAISLFERACSLEYTPAYHSYASSLMLIDILPRDYEKGMLLLNKAVEVGEIKAYETLAYYYYRNEHNIEKAIDCHIKLMKYGYKDSVNDLFYIIRRENVSLDGKYDFNQLLEAVKNSDSSFECVNYALYLLSLSSDLEVWREIDVIFTKLDEVESVEGWWTTLIEEEDMEGYLVLGLLQRHKKIEPNNKWNLKHCFEKASTVYDIPHWIKQQR